jgi:acyl transferase domain-containing protein/NAD(P)-dependent dehydrogenase (short-subunit alcohol dehydrogenase family)
MDKPWRSRVRFLRLPCFYLLAVFLGWASGTLWFALFEEARLSTADSATPLAIIGIGCLFPGADNLSAYWARIGNGVDAITDVPPTHWRPEDYYHPDPKAPDRIYTARGGFLHTIPFNPAAFGIAPHSLEATDTSQLLGLVVAQQALADAGYGEERSFDRSRVSVILGVTGTLELVIPLGARLGHPIWRRALREAGVPEHVAEEVVQRISDAYVGWQENSFPGLLGNVVAGRIANRFNLGGTNCVVDAACASSLSALHLACLELTTGRADMVLTGGVDTFNDIFMYMCFSKTPALSPTGDARPFDADADGTILGEGLGMIVLKRLEDARRAGDRIYAVLRGLGSSSDGRGNAIYAPCAAGQVEAIRKAYQVAGVTPDTIEMVEAHGTGTRLGDATEAAALTEVYRTAKRKGRWCALGSVKSQIGHTKAAAGVAGLIKAAAALYHKVLPPTIKVKQPIAPLQAEDSPFYINTEARPWMPSPRHPRRAAVSAFGFGGSNFHCVLEEASPHKETIDWDGDTQILAFTGPTLERLEQQLSQWPTDLSWPELRARAAQSRQKWDATAQCRLLFVLQRDRTDLAHVMAQARSWLRGGRGAGANVSEDFFLGCGPCSGKLAVLFPGQGAQYPGMLRELACHFPAMHDTLAQACQSAAQEGDLIDRIYPLIAFTAEARRANEEALRATDVAQPALGAVSLGAWRILEQFGVRATAAGGHSFGELTALCAAGRLKPEDFFRLSWLRGRLMADAADMEGAMLAVQATEETVCEVLRAENLDLVLANKNAPRQTVLSGPTAAIGRAAAAFAARKIPTQRLAVSAAFHSPLVASAVGPFRAALEEIEVPPGTMPVFANTTAQVYPEDAAGARELLAGQLARPVEFVREIERLHESGIRTFLEVGPGHRLTGLVSAILQDRNFAALALDRSNGRRSGMYDLACCLAHLAALGHEVRLSLWDADAPLLETPPGSQKRTFLVPLCGANYVKPKPQKINPSAVPAKASPAQAASGLMNGTLNPTMNGPNSPDSSALAQALQLTRDSLNALQRMQEQTAQLHRQFLDGQDAAQRTIQLLVEQQQRLLQASLGLPFNSMPVATPSTSTRHESAIPPPSLPLEASEPPGSTRQLAREGLPSQAPPTTEAAPAVSNKHVETILLEVIAEKTGYPAEMLELDMALDTDLGIDSIKRVEILSALQERLPQAPIIKPEHFGVLHKLRDIAAFLAGTEAAPAAQNVGDVCSHVEQRSEDVETILLEVIAEKTGYPAEMLELDMALDTDLGIDSIKRVEILSALQERLPQAPIIKPEHFGVLHKLRDIAAFLAGTSDGRPESGRSATGASELLGSTQQFARPNQDQPVDTDGSLQTLSASLERSILRVAPLTNASARPLLRLQPGALIWIASEDEALSGALVQRLRMRGYFPRCLPVAELCRQERPALLGALVIVANRQPEDEAFLQHALFGLQHVGPALRAAGSQGGALFVTVSRLDGAFGLVDLDAGRDPFDGGLAGLAKTVGQEWPDVHCKALDLADDFADSDQAAAALVEEMFCSGPVEVGLARGRQSTLERLVQPWKTGTTTPFQPGEVIVLSGGARGVTAEVAVALARAFRPTLVLLGRTPEPAPEPDWLAALTSENEIKRELGNRANGSASLKWVSEQYRLVSAHREIRRTLARIQDTGARVLYRAVDIRDATAVKALLTTVCQQLGAPIRGIIHGAGVLADARIEDKTVEQFERVYTTKVAGLQALLRAVDPNELRVLVLFSSLSARFGRAGQVDYAIANEVLNKLAHQQARRLPHCRVVSVNWGPWDGGMVNPALKKIFAQEGLSLIPLEAGANYLVEELRSAPGDAVEVVVLANGAATAKERASPLPSSGRSSVLPYAFERVLERAAHPVLESHILNGRPVLPVVLVLEWLAHGAMHQNPGLFFHGCNDLRILHGVVLDGDTAPLLRIHAGKAVKREGFYVAAVELRSRNADGRDTLHARAEIVLVNQLPTAPPAVPPPNCPPYARLPEEIYQNLLFHGPDLQGIEQIEGCGERGILGRVSNAPPPKEWIQHPLRQRWLADPLALDCSFQLLVVWSQEQHGAPSLPCYIARYRQYQHAFPGPNVRVVAHVTRDSNLHALADIDYLDQGGQVLARLQGYECVIDPALRRAFGRQSLASVTVP